MPGILAAGHGCDDLLQAVPFVREDVQRIASGSATDHAVVSVDYLFAASTLPHAHAALWHVHVPASRALDSTALRI